MKRQKPASTQARLLAQQPIFDRRQSEAIASLCRAGVWSGSRYWDKSADVLQLRMGLMLNNQRQRWGYQISNPGYYELLLRCPALDDAEPGPAWLRRVYTHRADRMPLTLNSARARLQQRRSEHESKAVLITPATTTSEPTHPQLDLFALCAP